MFYPPSDQQFDDCLIIMWSGLQSYALQSWNVPDIQHVAIQIWILDVTARRSYFHFIQKYRVAQDREGKCFRVSFKWPFRAYWARNLFQRSNQELKWVQMSPKLKSPCICIKKAISWLIQVNNYFPHFVRQENMSRLPCKLLQWPKVSWRSIFNHNKIDKKSWDEQKVLLLFHFIEIVSDWLLNIKWHNFWNKIIEEAQLIDILYLFKLPSIFPQSLKFLVYI